MKRKCLVFTAAFLAAVFLCTPAFAAGDKGDDAWHFDLAPFYLWAANIDGDVGVGPVDQQVDASFGDILDNLDFVLTAHFEARKGRFGMIFNMDYLDLGIEQSAPAGPALNVDFKTTIAEFDGFYRVNRAAHNFDLIAGVRYTKQDTEISLGPVPVGGLDESWWDPVIGARWQWGFAPQWSLSTRGDIGGFGVGTDFTWQLAGIIDWQPWKNVSLLAGYRALDQEYEDGDRLDRYKWDGLMHGPVFGLNFRW